MGSDDDLEVIEEQDRGARHAGMIDLVLMGYLLDLQLAKHVAPIWTT